MKNTIRFISVVLTVLCALTVFFGCEKDGGASSGSNVVLEEIKDIKEYRIVRPDSGSGAKEAMVALNNAINEKLGFVLNVATDAGSSSSKEILVGMTSRSASQKAAEGLNHGDWRVLRSDSKIIIIGGSDASLMKAVNFVIDKCISKERGSFAVPNGSGYSYIKSYPETFTVNGRDIKEYTITSPTYNVNNFVQRVEAEVVGAEMKSLKFDLRREGDPYIIVEESELIDNKYSVRVEDGNLIIRGSYTSTEAAIDYFCEKFVNANGKTNVALNDGFVYEGFTEKKEIPYTKDQLMQLLGDIYNDPDRLIVGEQGNGGGALPSEVLKTFKEASGELPGIMGLDLGIYGINVRTKKDDYLSQAVSEIVDFCSQGGILTISSHIENPYDPSQHVRGKLGEFSSTEELEQNFIDLVTEGTELNAAFKETLRIDGEFLAALRDNDVPVIWRPLHEMNGSWFWFCVTANGFTVDSEIWADVWRYIYNYYTNELKLDNLIWMYAPNVSENFQDTVGSGMSTLYCYPGNDYVDMVGVDAYIDEGSKDSFKGYTDIIDITGYIGAFTEFGPARNWSGSEMNKPQIEVFNCMDMYEFLMEKKDEGYQISYLLTWAGSLGASALGKCDEFMALDYTLGAKELKVMFDAMN